MLRSTSATEDPSEQELAQHERKLVERGLVVGQPPVLLKQSLALGFEHVDIVLELARPGLGFANVALELRSRRPRLVDGGGKLRRLVGQSHQLAAEREAVEVGGEQRP